ncbi:MAG: hypothetical protein IKQ61_01725 [Spirochaetales bacterium]|nr:hypothetical protein [Spirochaetales bacterium]
MRLLCFFTIFVLLISCLPHDYPVEQVIEYIPEKAGAEITKRIPFGHYDYVNYQNNQLYALSNGGSTDTVTFYDLTNDTVIVKNTLYIPKMTFSEYYRYVDTLCLNIINEEIILLSSIRDNAANKSYNALLCYNEIDSSITFYDHSSDFDNIDSMCQFYFDSNYFAYFAPQKYYRTYQKLHKYHYNIEEKTFLLKENKNFNNYGYIFLTQNYCMLNDYGVDPASDVLNVLYIYYDYNSSPMKKINLNFLNLNSEIFGAFSDSDGNIWLAGKEYDSNTNTHSYELLELKLLTTEAAEDEYRRTSCW